MRNKLFYSLLTLGSVFISASTFSQNSETNESSVKEGILQSTPSSILTEENVGTIPVTKTPIVIANSTKMTLEEKHAKYLLTLPAAIRAGATQVEQNIEK